MISRTQFNASRFRSLEERFQPENPAEFFAAQRAWFRLIVQMRSLTPIQRVAVMFIGSMHSPDRPYCVAGMTYICKAVGCERTTVLRATKLLEDDGLMIVDRRKRAGNIYKLVPPPTFNAAV